jgi:hypothetical protein
MSVLFPLAKTLSEKKKRPSIRRNTWKNMSEIKCKGLPCPVQSLVFEPSFGKRIKKCYTVCACKKKHKWRKSFLELFNQHYSLIPPRFYENFGISPDVTKQLLDSILKCSHKQCRVIHVDLGPCLESYPCQHPNINLVYSCGKREEFRGEKEEVWSRYEALMSPDKHCHFSTRRISAFVAREHLRL